MRVIKHIMLITTVVAAGEVIMVASAGALASGWVYTRLRNTWNDPPLLLALLRQDDVAVAKLSGIEPLLLHALRTDKTRSRQYS